MPEYISAEILRWAVVLADEQSFSGAAQKLQVDPSVLRAHIHELSTRIGCQIFREMEDRVEQTEAGKVLIQAARGYLAWLAKQMK
jgi:DNA-binding transcriptional LysR family regulator